MAPIVVTDGSFTKDVLQSQKPVLVDFWADWCGPCRLIAPVLEEIAASHADRLTIAKLDIEANPRTTGTYGITGIPTLNLYVGGEVVKQIRGAKSKGVLLKELADFI